MLAAQLLGALHKSSGDAPLSPVAWWAYAAASGFLVLLAGLMSGLTLGLMSLDEVDMEVLKRSGTEQEKRCAAAIERVIKDQHLLLVTLLLCNALAAEALPLFLDKLVDPVTAVILSVTVVLVFGEIAPQAICSRYGLQVGAGSAWLVRVLMVLMWPLAAPIAALLDYVLGGHHTALMRRAQLKALVGLHAEAEGGVLSKDEISIITGALDLTHKTAWTAMTPLDKVFMLDMDRVVDEGLLQDVLNTGHSRIPVCRNGDRCDLVGLVLVKELVLLDPAPSTALRELQLRPLPCLSADTPLYMLLQLFEAGGSHMVVLTKPRLGTASSMPRVKSGMIRTGSGAYWVESSASAAAPTTEEGWGGGSEGDPIGIITIEDVIEELLQQEIIDETDLFMDNEQRQQVDPTQLSRSLPPNLQSVYAKEFTPRVGRLTANLPARQRQGGVVQRRAISSVQGASPLLRAVGHQNSPATRPVLPASASAQSLRRPGGPAGQRVVRFSDDTNASLNAPLLQ